MTWDRWRSLVVCSIFWASTAAFADEVPSVQAQPATYGLGAWIRPINPVEFTFDEQTKLIAQERKDRVHFFLINGLDPCYAGNLNGVAAYFRSIGFVNTNCCHFISTGKVRQQI